MISSGDLMSQTRK